jgi:hypothetical protein
LEHLIEDNLNDLFTHFKALGIEMIMFASQWFLTLFAAKVPRSPTRLEALMNDDDGDDDDVVVALAALVVIVIVMLLLLLFLMMMTIIIIITR